ncbi:hypothetical protein [Morganella morganii]|uniref:hypothetical protein n=1 Tax=Morganella morganii TaxID=582 RepID=UPI00046AA7BB|nr:hypothetical protein [Morganella morganii]
MTDFNTLTKIPFGWYQIFLYYIIFFVVFFVTRKLMNFLIKINNSFLDFIYILVIMAIGGGYLTVFKLGENFILGRFFISSGGNKDIIIWSSLLFSFILAFFSSPNIRK